MPCSVGSQLPGAHNQEIMDLAPLPSFLTFERGRTALVSVAQWLEHHPIYRKVAGLVPAGAHMKGHPSMVSLTSMSVSPSPSLSLSFALSLKSISISSGKD